MNAVYSSVKSHFVSGFVSSFTMGKYMEVTTEDPPARRMSTQRTTKTSSPKAGVSKWSHTRQIIDMYFEQLH